MLDSRGGMPMDAPKGRYRVEERGRRLVVIDTAAGTAGFAAGAAPPSPPPPAGHIGPAPAAAPRLVDRIGLLLLHLVVNRWEDDGRAVIGWEWESNGRKERWDARLGADQQRRLGRALVAIAAFPLLILLFVLGFWPLWPLAFPALGAAALGVLSIHRLQRETGGG
jgi:hypothetical protein